MELPEDVYEADERFNGKQVYWKEYSSQRKKVVIRECEICGESCFKQVSNIKSGRGRYCSRSCSAKATHSKIVQKGKENPNYKGKKDYVEDIKRNGSCSICDESRKKALCFHHRDPDEKVDSISRMAVRSDYSLEDVKDEVKKCDLICFNCHEVHYSETKRVQHP